MNRHSLLAIAFVAVSMMVCACGGAGNQVNNPKSQVKSDDEARGDGKAMAKKPLERKKAKGRDEVGLAIPERKVFRGTVPIVIPAQRKVDQSLIAIVDSVKIELVSGKLGEIDFMRRSVNGMLKLRSEKRLVMKVAVTNNKNDAIVYKPWHSIDPAKSYATKRPVMSDENDALYINWFPQAGSWPVGGVETAEKIAPKKSLTDIVAFAHPAFGAEEFTISLPGDNVGLPGKPFAFKIGRRFFEDETERTKAIASNAKKIAEEEEDRLQAIEDKRIAVIEAARQQAIRDAAPKITQANFVSIRQGERLEDVQAILGPGRMVSQSGELKIYRWQSDPVVFEVPATIVITFRNDSVYSKSIFGN